MPRADVPIAAREHRPASAAAMLASPIFTGAVLVLIVNDQLLKRLAPGLVTGKLSDVAGLVVIAVLARCVVRSDTGAVVGVAVGFVLLKTVGMVAVFAAPVLGGPTLLDPTDLVALAVLVPVLVWFRSRRPPSSGRVRPAALLQVSAVFFAVLATTATSCASPPRVDRLVANGSTVWAGVADKHYRANGDSYPVVRWARSDDAGRTWVASPKPGAGTVATHRACAERQCWRTIPDERVEVNAGSGWRTAFEFTAEQQRRIDLSTPCGGVLGSDTFGPLTIVDGSRGALVVAMGSQGVLRYDGQDWQRVRVLGCVPPAMPGPSWLPRAVAVSLSALIAFGVVLMIGAAFRDLWHRPRSRWLVTGAVVVGVAFGLAILESAFMLYNASYALRSLIGIFGAAVTFVVSIIVVARRGQRPSERAAGEPDVDALAAPTGE